MRRNLTGAAGTADLIAASSSSPGTRGKRKRPGIPQVFPSAARPSFLQKTRRFPPPPREGFGFIGCSGTLWREYSREPAPCQGTDVRSGCRFPRRDTGVRIPPGRSEIPGCRCRCRCIPRRDHAPAFCRNRRSPSANATGSIPNASGIFTGFGWRRCSTRRGF